jgi:hypothetical protein
MGILRVIQIMGTSQGSISMMKEPMLPIPVSSVAFEIMLRICMEASLE